MSRADRPSRAAPTLPMPRDPPKIHSSTVVPSDTAVIFSFRDRGPSFSSSSLHHSRGVRILKRGGVGGGKRGGRALGSFSSSSLHHRKDANVFPSICFVSKFRLLGGAGAGGPAWELDKGESHGYVLVRAPVCSISLGLAVCLGASSIVGNFMVAPTLAPSRNLTALSEACPVLSPETDSQPCPAPASSTAYKAPTCPTLGHNTAVLAPCQQYGCQGSQLEPRSATRRHFLLWGSPGTDGGVGGVLDLGGVQEVEDQGGGDEAHQARDQAGSCPGAPADGLPDGIPGAAASFSACVHVQAPQLMVCPMASLVQQLLSAHAFMFRRPS